MRAAFDNTWVYFQNRLCITCNGLKGLTKCPLCDEPFPRKEVEQCTRAQGSSAQIQWLNVHALGEQFIEKVTGVRISQRAQKGEHLEREHLEFKAHVRGWKIDIRKNRCQSLLQKSDSNLRQELCSYRRNGTKTKFSAHTTGMVTRLQTEIRDARMVVRANRRNSRTSVQK
jgi:hypothetical protein